MSITVFVPKEDLLGKTIRHAIESQCDAANVTCIKIGDGDIWTSVKQHTAYHSASEFFDFVVVVESHCEFEAMTSLVNSLRELQLDTKLRGSLIFTSDHFDTPTPELNDGKRTDLIENLRYSQFYLRMFENYGWSTFTSAARFASLLHRIETLPAEYLQLTNSSLEGWKTDVNRIRKSIDARLNLGVWANTPQPTQNNGWKASTKLSRRFFRGLSDNLLESMALVHQFGRLNSPKAEKRIEKTTIEWIENWIKRRAVSGFSPPHLRNLLQVSTIAARDLWETSTKHERLNSTELHLKLVKNAGLRNIIRVNMFVFDLLRDCSQMLSKGTAVWAVECGRQPVQQGEKPVRVLAIKDRIRGVEEQKLTEELFKSAFDAAFRRGTLILHCIDYLENDENQPWDRHDWWLDRIEGREKVQVRDDSGSGDTIETHLLDYDIVLIEAEYSNRFVGPSIIQWLDHMFDEAQNAPEFRRPQVFVLSRDENAGHSFMCLWLGAQAFASKSRIFGIPSLLTMANIRNLANDPEKKRLRPNFYALEGLLPHQRNRLQSLRKRDIVYGDDWDRYWIKKLPKADLHYHIGTSISLETIKALAANTVGHMIESVNDDLLDIKKSESLTFDDVLGENNKELVAKEVILNACKIALLYATERAESNYARNVDPYKHLWGAARFILLPFDKSGRVVSKDAPEFNALDAVVQWLVRNDRPVRSHEACAILVTAITVLECLHAGESAESEFAKRVYSNWMAIESAARCLESTRPGSLVGYLDMNLFYLLERIAANWKDNYTGESIKGILETARSEDRRSRSFHFVAGLAEASIKRSIKVFAVFKRAFDSLIHGSKSNWLFLAEEEFNKHGAEPMFSHIGDLVRKSIKSPSDLFNPLNLSGHISLEKLVLLPTDSGDKNRNGSLKRYLVGCDLLGAEHLQYPENIILAACDITRQNAEDNVVYSELRCATTGYGRGGMNVIDATDLLCKSFDLGAVLFGTKEPGLRIAANDLTTSALSLRGPEVILITIEGAKSRWEFAPRRWIRSNILLGAKRHKPGDIENVVPLVVHYLERGLEVWQQHNDGVVARDIEPGHWWRMCSVAGFDLSGNEAVTIHNLEANIRPLFAACSPITIHAGEAMSANSIWEAVYKLNAQRIGHGLRLRDDSRLLEHCVRNDICMELCPVSNSFTNSFKPISRPELNGGTIRHPSLKRDEYPMLDFLSAGLEVCLNTDNRSIHPERSTLTDEYLKAAELCGGLTKWEILRVAKAGFKNAFLAKDDAASLLRHVEYEVYKFLCEHSGENKFPQVERLMPIGHSTVLKK